MDKEILNVNFGLDLRSDDTPESITAQMYTELTNEDNLETHQIITLLHKIKNACELSINKIEHNHGKC